MLCCFSDTTNKNKSLEFWPKLFSKIVDGPLIISLYYKTGAIKLLF